MQRDVAREPRSGRQGFGQPPAALTAGSESNIARLPRLRQQTQVVNPRLINPDPVQRLAALKRRHHDFANESLASRIENAVKKVLAAGYRTGDIYEAGTRKVSCSEMGDQIVTAM